MCERDVFPTYLTSENFLWNARGVCGNFTVEGDLTVLGSFAGGGSVPPLTTVLGSGNTTSGQNIVISTGDQVTLDGAVLKDLGLYSPDDSATVTVANSGTVYVSGGTAGASFLNIDTTDTTLSFGAGESIEMTSAGIDLTSATRVRIQGIDIGTGTTPNTGDVLRALNANEASWQALPASGTTDNLAAIMGNGATMLTGVDILADGNNGLNLEGDSRVFYDGAKSLFKATAGANVVGLYSSSEAQYVDVSTAGVNIEGGASDVVLDGSDVTIAGISFAPAVAPTAGQVLVSDGGTGTSWQTLVASGTPDLASVMNVNNTTPTNVDLVMANNSDITFGSSGIIEYDSGTNRFIVGSLGANTLRLTGNIGIGMTAGSGDIDINAAAGDITVDATDITATGTVTATVTAPDAILDGTTDAHFRTPVRTSAEGVVSSGSTVGTTLNSVCGRYDVILAPGSGTRTFSNARLGPSSALFIQTDIAPSELDRVHVSARTGTTSWELRWRNDLGVGSTAFSVWFFIVNSD